MLSTLLSVSRLLLGDPRGWEFELQRFDAEDAEARPEPGRVVFTGSSSIRFWESLEEDMAPWPALRRGFGGCKMADVRYHLERVCLQYAPRAVVLYAGDNDLGLFSRTTPAQVAEALADIEAALHGRFPEAPLLVLSVKPSPLRWRQWPRMQEANVTLRAFAEAKARCHWVDVATPMLGADGRPRRELFGRDGLHMSAEGYRLWTGLLREALEDAGVPQP